MNEQNHYDGKTITAVNTLLSKDAVQECYWCTNGPPTSRETLPHVSMESREVRHG